MTRGPGLREPVFATDRRSEELEELQYTLGQGPFVDATGLDGPVLVADLAAADSRGRWPLFAPAAIATGYAAVQALPMRLRDATIGAINLFSAAPGALDAEAVALGQALADVATIGILHERAVRQHEVVEGQLQAASTPGS